MRNFKNKERDKLPILVSKTKEHPYYDRIRWKMIKEQAHYDNQQRLIVELQNDLATMYMNYLELSNGQTSRSFYPQS